MNGDELTDAVVNYYLSSGDYNGLPAYALTRDGTVDLPELKALLHPLIENDVLAVNFGEVHVNPHIRAFPDPPAQEQLSRLQSFAGDYFVLYPTHTLLGRRVNSADFEGRPFSLRLALGAPQLAYESFDMAVIDHYRRDPRYRFWSNDVTATLSIGDEAYVSQSFPDKHKVLIQHFGFSYDDQHRRAVAVFLTDLDGLTPEHQQVWAAFQLTGNYKLQPDFYRAAILGDWGLKVSLRDAFVEELKTINAMCLAIGWPKLFRNEFAEPPKELAFLIRPTEDEFHAFVQTLDKLMSENINRDFFPASISRELEHERPDGKVAVHQCGTIQLLDQWLRQSFRTPDTEPVDECLATFREVRKKRQKPAHAVLTAKYDEALFEQQRQLFIRAYSAVRTLRLVIQNHPRARAVRDKMNEQVRNGEIWSL